MRRKSERTASKKVKASPEKKVEKPKRGRTRRSKKPSTSSENESAEDASPVRAPEPPVVAEVKPPATPVKDPSPEESNDQVWQVKAAQGSSDVGEIQKLKICLKRPPSTPERVDRSPRSKRKHSRATSSSDTPSADGSEEKKKKHKSRRATRESKDDSFEKSQESQSDEPDKKQSNLKNVEKSDEPENEISQSSQPAEQTASDEIPMSTTTEETKESADTPQTAEEDSKTSQQAEASTEQEKPSDADTTVESPKQSDTKKSDNAPSEAQENSEKDDDSPVQIIEIEIEKSPASEPEQEDTKAVDEPATRNNESDATEPEKEPTTDKVTAEKKVSREAEPKGEQSLESSKSKDKEATNDNNVVEKVQPAQRKISSDSDKDDESQKKYRRKEVERSESVQSAQSTQEEPVANGQAAPIVINRKRRWGSRPSKVASQKSITISTDVLKDIIPDVKPVEFETVIEEKEKKQHKRVDISERIERPVLPKIVIDNTDNVEARREQDDKENVKSKDSLPKSNRKISIVKDIDIITRPPSPPRNKQSHILYITNLVRPFTLPQLKNLLQRTGRIAEGGFWIDRIKSRCFVIYENEDQAVETRHALHGVTWPVSNPKTLQVDFSSQEAFDKAKANEDTENVQSNSIPGTVEDWLREQDAKRERGELEKPWERKTAVREWDVGKGDKAKEETAGRDERGGAGADRRRHRTQEHSPEPAKKFKKEEEAPAKLLDDLFRKTKTTPCIYWLPLSDETIAIKEEQRRQHMAEHERRLHELRRHRRH